jgi:type IV secretory pathway VirB10-like protein
MRIRTIAIAGLAATAVAYLFDPITGSARRSRLRERMAAFTLRRTTPEQMPPLPDNMIPAPEDAPEERAKGPVADTPPQAPEKEAVADASQAPEKEAVADTSHEPAKEDIAYMPQERLRGYLADTREDRPMDDAAIAARIRMKVLGRPDLETSSLVVDVVQGVAFLRGDLKDRRQIDEVVDLTGAVPGVRKVQNLIHLPESQTIPRPAAPLGDAWNA